jgi:hypothetical protein
MLTPPSRRRYYAAELVMLALFVLALAGLGVLIAYRVAEVTG